jgi:hypothetical protein
VLEVRWRLIFKVIVASLQEHLSEQVKMWLCVRTEVKGGWHFLDLQPSWRFLDLQPSWRFLHLQLEVKQPQLAYLWQL